MAWRSILNLPASCCEPAWHSFSSRSIRRRNPVSVSVSSLARAAIKASRSFSEVVSIWTSGDSGMMRGPGVVVSGESRVVATASKTMPHVRRSVDRACWAGS